MFQVCQERLFRKPKRVFLHDFADDNMRRICALYLFVYGNVMIINTILAMSDRGRFFRQRMYSAYDCVKMVLINVIHRGVPVKYSSNPLYDVLRSYISVSIYCYQSQNCSIESVVSDKILLKRSIIRKIQTKNMSFSDFFILLSWSCIDLNVNLLLQCKVTK